MRHCRLSQRITMREISSNFLHFRKVKQAQIKFFLFFPIFFLYYFSHIFSFFFFKFFLIFHHFFLFFLSFFLFLYFFSFCPVFSHVFLFLPIFFLFLLSGFWTECTYSSFWSLHRSRAPLVVFKFFCWAVKKCLKNWNSNSRHFIEILKLRLFWANLSTNSIISLGN